VRQYPRNKADSEELVRFFLELARKNFFNLRVKNDGPAFVLKHLVDNREEDDTWMNVDANSTSDKAVRIDRKCGARQLHGILEKMRVPHEYRKEGFEEELAMTAYAARKHLEKAFDILSHRGEEGKKHTHRLGPQGGEHSR
jgi:hypothetical protein